MAGLDVDEFRRWWGHREHTLASAQRDADAADFGWACFEAQQTAEYKVKALLGAVGDPAVGHFLTKLLETLEQRSGVAVPDPVRHLARRLERHYIPSRYPDAFPSGMPYEFYDAPPAAQAIQAARGLAGFVWEQAPAMGMQGRHHERAPGDRRPGATHWSSRR